MMFRSEYYIRSAFICPMDIGRVFRDPCVGDGLLTFSPRLEGSGTGINIDIDNPVLEAHKMAKIR